MNVDSTVRLHSGRDMPVLGLGTWLLQNDTAGTVQEALRLGYRMIDTSGDYGTQPGIAEALRRTDVERDRIYLVTKIEEDEDAYDATRRNLDELGVERADLMLIHRPPPGGPGVDLWEGLVRARDDGLATDIGVSNYRVDQMENLLSATAELPAVNQVEWSPFGWSPDMREWCRGHNVVIQAYSPLTRTQRLRDPRLVAVAERKGKSAAQVLLRWNLQLGTVPLPKANRPDHLAEDIDVFDFELTDEDLGELATLNQHASSLGSLPYG